MTPNLLSALDTRSLSGDGIFRIRPGNDIYRILAAAEAWGPGAVVVFWPGEYELHETFEFRNIAAILGFGINVTRFKRFGQTIFRSVWKYAEQNHAPRIGGFNIQNMVPDTEPAIEIGGSQNLSMTGIYSWGSPGDLVRFVNAEPTESQPLGKPFGTWTENICMDLIIISGPRKAGISFRVADGQRRFQSFSNFKSGMIQIALTEPGSVGIEMEDHVLFYSARLAAKFNIELSAQGNATCIKVGPYCTVAANHYEMYVEGVPLRDEDGNIIRSAGRRIHLDPTSRVTGTGTFWRQDPSAIDDWITPGMTWDHKPGGFVENGILKDQIS